jgi:methylated-DNA-[protein]-cysteine S-methyltransferase
MREDRNMMVFKTALGWAGVAVSDHGVCAIVLPKKEKKAVERELKSPTSTLTPALSPGGRGKKGEGALSSRGIEKMLERAAKLLSQYFSGERVSFDLPVDMRYHTAFRQAVWKATAEIPRGETRSYAWVAKRIRKPGAARATGQALGANPVPIIIP